MEQQASLVNGKSGQGRLRWRKTSYQIQVGLISNASNRCEVSALCLLLRQIKTSVIVCIPHRGFMSGITQPGEAAQSDHIQKQDINLPCDCWALPEETAPAAPPRGVPWPCPDGPVLELGNLGTTKSLNRF